MILWAVAFLSLSLGFKFLFGEAFSSMHLSGSGAERAALRRVADLLRELEETLGAGLVPELSRWNALRALPAPWGALAYESLMQLRSQGGALVPTLRRIRFLSEEHQSVLSDAKSRSSQAMAQALVCAALVPIFGGGLYLVLPGLENRPYAWALACGLAMALSLVAASWLLKIADRARWAGLEGEQRAWLISAQCAGERFLALVRSGTPPDSAWSGACELLKREASGLALEWGFTLWGGSGTKAVSGAPAARSLVDLGESLRKTVQVSLMDGKPCTDKVETALQALRSEMRAHIERELTLLGTRALKPLFLLVAPALLGLLGFGLWLCWGEVSGGGPSGF